MASPRTTARYFVMTLAFAFSCSGQSAPPMNVKLLPPAAFKSVPENVRTWLQNQGCSVPQDESIEQPNNVVAGEFAKKGQIDWAALCAKDGTMQVSVLWGGENKCVTEPRSKKDPIANVWSQQTQQPPFMTYVRRATVKRTLQLNPGNRITHDAVEYGGESASVLYLCDASKWVELRGAD